MVSLLLTVSLATAAAPRLAVVAVTPEAEARTVADQLTAALSRDPATLALVERQQIDAVLRELGLAATQGRGGQLALGERLNAQVLLLLDVADQTLTARLVDSTSGLILFSEGWPTNAVQGQGLPEAATARLRERILTGLRQAAALAGGASKGNVTLVAVVPLRNRLWDDTDNRRAETLSRLLALQLSRQPDLLLVERNELRRVAEEKGLAATATGRLAAAAVIVTGSTLFLAVKTGTGKTVTVETAFQRGAAPQPGPAVTGDADDLMGVATQLAREIAARLRLRNTAVADSAVAPPFDAAGEARYLLWIANCLHVNDEDKTTVSLLEAALALNPKDPEIRQAVADALLGYPGRHGGEVKPPLDHFASWMSDSERALHLLLAEPPVFISIGCFPSYLNVLRPEDLTPEQRLEVRRLRGLFRRYTELEWDVRDGVPHRSVSGMFNLLPSIPAMFETPEAAMVYLEPMAACWLRSSERSYGEDTVDIFQSIIRVRNSFVACPRWRAATVEPLFDAMLGRLQPLAETGDPLTHAELDFIIAYRDIFYPGRSRQGYGCPPQSLAAVKAARDLLAICQNRAASNSQWSRTVKARQAQMIWQALGCPPLSEQETWFNDLLLPALRQGYWRDFSYPAGEYFSFPLAPAPSPEYQRILIQAYTVLSRQSGPDLDNLLHGLRFMARELKIVLTDGLPGNGDDPVREIDLLAAGLPKNDRCFIAGFVQEPETIWFQIKGGWDGVLRYDVAQARVTGAVKWPWGSGRNPTLACGGQQLTVTADAVWWSEGSQSQICRMPKTAFSLPAPQVDPATAAMPGLNPSPYDKFAVVDDWIYWCAENGGIWRLRHAAGKPVGTAECVADSTRGSGIGLLDGRSGWGAITLVADPPRHRVLCLVWDSPSDGPRGGVWSHQVDTGRLECVVVARLESNGHAQASTVNGDRWVYSAGSFMGIVMDLRDGRVAYNLRPAIPFLWNHPGDKAQTQAPAVPLAMISSECFDAWTRPCFTVTPAAPDALLLFAPRGDNVRVRVFTPTTCLAEVKNDARLLDQMVTGAWWTPRGILVAAVPERTGPMKLWLYEVATKTAPLAPGK